MKAAAPIEGSRFRRLQASRAAAITDSAAYMLEREFPICFIDPKDRSNVAKKMGFEAAASGHSAVAAFEQMSAVSVGMHVTCSRVS